MPFEDKGLEALAQSIINKGVQKQLQQPNTPGQGKGFLPNLAEKIKQIASRNRGVNKPQ